MEKKNENDTRKQAIHNLCDKIAKYYYIVSLVLFFVLYAFVPDELVSLLQLWIDIYILITLPLIILLEPFLKLHYKEKFTKKEAVWWMINILAWAALAVYLVFFRIL